jgi:hypothetical protein
MLWARYQINGEYALFSTFVPSSPVACAHSLVSLPADLAFLCVDYRPDSAFGVEHTFPPAGNSNACAAGVLRWHTVLLCRVYRYSSCRRCCGVCCHGIQVAKHALIRQTNRVSMLVAGAFSFSRTWRCVLVSVARLLGACLNMVVELPGGLDRCR